LIVFEMAQVKKEAVRVRILDAASRLFEERGYVGATMGQIAARARLSSANIYDYFPSKLAIAFAIFEPWIGERVAQIEVECASIRDPRTRLGHALGRLWRDIPFERNSFLNNFIQAIAVSTIDEGYRPIILTHMRERIEALISNCIGGERREIVDIGSIAHLAVMAFDGFVINGHLNPNTSRVDASVEAVCDLILGRRTSRAQTTAQKKSAKAIKARAG
jgi:AcrR family transcriptional regulator